MKLTLVIFFLLQTVFVSFVKAQHAVNVKLTVITKQFGSTTNPEHGLLVDVINNIDQDIAIYTPPGQLLDQLKFYKYDEKQQSYQEIIHPYKLELERQRELADSLYKASEIIVDFFGSNNYEWKSPLYREFVETDTLWFDYTVRRTAYEKNVSNADVATFERTTGLTAYASEFTLIKAKERFQDFTNINFLYKENGNYKIALELVNFDLKGKKHSLYTFLLIEPSKVLFNNIDLEIN